MRSVASSSSLHVAGMSSLRDGRSSAAEKSAEREMGVSEVSSGSGSSGAMAEELARHVVSVLTASFRKLLDILVGAFQPQVSASRVPGPAYVSRGAEQRGGAVESGSLSGALDPFFRVLTAL